MLMGRKQLTVGELIKELDKAVAKCDADAVIRFDFCGLPPVRLASYRGFYEDLAIGYGGADDEDVLLVDFAAKVKAMLGETIEGYKGGTYRVTEDTAVWVANHGTCFGTYVCGINAHETWNCVIQTRWCSC
jgi:hypothetical protein